MVQVATTTIIVNEYITTPITLEVRLSKESYNLNVAQAHRKIFFVIKRNDPTLLLQFSMTT